MTDLRKELAITTQEHFEVLSAVMQDKEIEALRENRAPEPGGPPGNAALLDSGGPGKRKKDALGQGGIRCMGPAHLAWETCNPECSELKHAAFMTALRLTS